MNTDERLYTLMAQAEDLQAHAEKLQQEASETFSALPLAVEQAAKKIRFTGLQMALIMLGIAAVVCGAAVAFIGWSTSSLRVEAEGLRAEVSSLEARAREFSAKAGKAQLLTCQQKNGKARLCVRVDGKAGQFGDTENGEVYMILYGY